MGHPPALPAPDKPGLLFLRAKVATTSLIPSNIFRSRSPVSTSPAPSLVELSSMLKLALAKLPPPLRTASVFVTQHILAAVSDASNKIRASQSSPRADADFVFDTELSLGTRTTTISSTVNTVTRFNSALDQPCLGVYVHAGSKLVFLLFRQW